MPALDLMLKGLHLASLLLVNSLNLAWCLRMQTEFRDDGTVVSWRERKPEVTETLRNTWETHMTGTSLTQNPQIVLAKVPLRMGSLPREETQPSYTTN